MHIRYPKLKITKDVFATIIFKNRNIKELKCEKYRSKRTASKGLSKKFVRGS